MNAQTHIYTVEEYFQAQSNTKDTVSAYNSLMHRIAREHEQGFKAIIDTHIDAACDEFLMPGYNNLNQQFANTKIALTNATELTAFRAARVAVLASKPLDLRLSGTARSSLELARLTVYAGAGQKATDLALRGLRGKHRRTAHALLDATTIPLLHERALIFGVAAPLTQSTLQQVSEPAKAAARASLDKAVLEEIRRDGELYYGPSAGPTLEAGNQASTPLARICMRAFFDAEASRMADKHGRYGLPYDFHYRCLSRVSHELVRITLESRTRRQQLPRLRQLWDAYKQYLRTDTQPPTNAAAS